MYYFNDGTVVIMVISVSLVRIREAYSRRCQVDGKLYRIHKCDSENMLEVSRDILSSVPAEHMEGRPDLTPQHAATSLQPEYAAASYQPGPVTPQQLEPAKEFIPTRDPRDGAYTAPDIEWHAALFNRIVERDEARAAEEKRIRVEREIRRNITTWVDVVVYTT